jgi:hypothetical protein
MARKKATTAPTVSQLALPYFVNNFSICISKQTYEHGLTTSVPDSVSEDVEDDHVKDKDDEGDESTKSSSHRHHDGSEPGSSCDTDDTKDNSNESKTSSDGVEDKTVR